MPWIWMGIIEVEAGSKSTNIAHSNLRSRLIERNRRNPIQDNQICLNNEVTQNKSNQSESSNKSKRQAKKSGNKKKITKRK
jgi:hypothetical protein